MLSFGMRDRVMRGNMIFGESSVHPLWGAKKRLLGFRNAVMYRLTFLYLASRRSQLAL